MLNFDGTAISMGYAIGKILYLNNSKKSIPKYTITDTEKEMARLIEARDAVYDQLTILNERAKESIGGKNALIFQFHQMLLNDNSLRDYSKNIIINEHMNCEYAVKKTSEHFYNIFANLEDDYMRERADDIVDLSNKLLNTLMSENEISKVNITEPFIIAARELYPSDTLSFTKENILGIITSVGSFTSHASIISRILGIPSISNTNAVLERLNGRYAILDGEKGKLFVDPTEGMLSQYRSKKERYEQYRQMLNSQKNLPTETIDGKKIGLFATIGSIDGAQVAIDNDAEGIGFLKSDFLFAGRESLPSEDEQFMAYRAISKTMGTKVTNICMLDMLPEQECSYFNISKESNPAMGMRGIRLLLENPSVLKKQLRAIYRASAFGKVSICIPMVSSANEVRSFKKTAKEVRDELKREGINYDPSTQIGIIVETPAAAVISDILAEMVDFINIGTNDLTQYTLAVDRNNEDLINFYITAHKAVLRLIKMTIQNAHKAEIPVGICGDLAADKRLTEKFLRYGADSFSIIPSKILEMRSEIRKVDLNEKKSK